MIIKKDRMTVEDTNNNLIETEKGITCGCGNPSFRMVCHMDGIDFFGFQYQCVCGNSIMTKTQRENGNMMM